MKRLFLATKSRRIVENVMSDRSHDKKTYKYRHLHETINIAFECTPFLNKTIISLKRSTSENMSLRKSATRVTQGLVKTKTFAILVNRSCGYTYFVLSEKNTSQIHKEIIAICRVFYVTNSALIL